MSTTGYGCTKIVGFLFPHPCGRLTPVDCPYCNRPNTLDTDNYFQMPNHPYQRDRGIYPRFGQYDSPEWSAVIDFTEGDGASLLSIGDFEMDFGAS